jgi:hypothetical protein
MNENEKMIEKRKELYNIITMIKEFDYIKNGKQATIEFLEYVLDYIRNY